VIYVRCRMRIRGKHRSKPDHCYSVMTISGVRRIWCSAFGSCFKNSYATSLAKSADRLLLRERAGVYRGTRVLTVPTRKA
jgi:hypothetical protein